MADGREEGSRGIDKSHQRVMRVLVAIGRWSALAKLITLVI